jgi:hypothetical protein
VTSPDGKANWCRFTCKGAWFAGLGARVSPEVLEVLTGLPDRVRQPGGLAGSRPKGIGSRLGGPGYSGFAAPYLLSPLSRATGRTQCLRSPRNADAAASSIGHAVMTNSTTPSAGPNVLLGESGGATIGFGGSAKSGGSGGSSCSRSDPRCGTCGVVVAE